MSAYTGFFNFMFRSFSLLGYQVSFFKVIVFGSLCSIVGYFIGSFFKK